MFKLKVFKLKKNNKFVFFYTLGTVQYPDSKKETLSLEGKAFKCFVGFSKPSTYE